jgi:hypothetical protein
MLRTQAVGMKSLQAASGLLTWYPSASTADSLLQIKSVIVLSELFGQILPVSFFMKILLHDNCIQYGTVQ